MPNTSELTAREILKENGIHELSPYEIPRVLSAMREIAELSFQAGYEVGMVSKYLNDEKRVDEEKKVFLNRLFPEK